jgi:uncharacterized membrane protein
VKSADGLAATHPAEAGEGQGAAWTLLGVGLATGVLAAASGVGGELLFASAEGVTGRTLVDLQSRRDRRVIGQVLAWSGVGGGALALTLMGVGATLLVMDGGE